MRTTKILLVSLLMILTSEFGFAKDLEIKYKVGKDETAWFLAQIFYEKGSDYSKILSVNSMKSPDEIITGKEIKIINPIHHPKELGFAERYSRLWEKRENALSLRNTGAKAVVVATNLRQKNQAADGLPFTLVRDPKKTPVDKAKEELEKLSEKENIKRSSQEGLEPF